MDDIKMKTLTNSIYEKSNDRTAWRNMSYPEKVRCVVALQERVAPILASRHKIIKPWRDVP